jgi:hypothetical protein
MYVYPALKSRINSRAFACARTETAESERACGQEIPRYVSRVVAHNRKAL